MKKAFGVIYFLILILPFSGLVTGDFYLPLFSARRAGLLANSLKLAAVSSAAAAVIGFFAAVGIHTGRLGRKGFRYLFLITAPVPYYIYALAWMYLARMIGRTVPELMKLQGFLPCVFVSVMSFLPLCTAFALFGLENHNASSEEMGLVYGGTGRVLVRIVLPDILPLILSGAGLVFVLSMTDFSVPSLFQYNTYTLEIFSEYGSGEPLNRIFLLSLPYIAVVFLILGAVQKRLRSISLRSREKRRPVSAVPGFWIRGLGGAAVLLCAFQIVFPVLAFLAGIKDWGEIIDSFLLCKEEFLVSLAVSLLAAAGALVISWGAAEFLVSLKKGAGFLWNLAVLPLAVPGALTAMGLLENINGSVLHGFSQTLVFPAVGCMIRYLPFSLLIMAAFLRRLDRGELELAAVYAGDTRVRANFRQFAFVKLPVLLPGAIAAFGTVFLLSMGEESVGLIMMPPGYQTFAVKIYNYLHYGASELVSGFCLLMMLLTGVTMAGILCGVNWLNGRKRNRI